MSDSPETLAPGIYLHRSTPPPNPTPSSPPPILVLCTWMGAARKHIDVYVRRYRELLPSTSLLVIRASVSDVFKPHAHRERHLRPAIAAFEAVLADAPPGSPSPVLHAFSNGGTLMAVQFAMSLRKERGGVAKGGKGEEGFFGKIILDCAPSYPRPIESARAMTVGVPTSLYRRAFATLIARFVFIIWQVIEWVIRRKNMLLWLREKVNERGVLTGGQRMYLYSEGDLMVGWKDVQSHADEARRLKLADVREVRFKKAAHCALPIEDFEKYWGSIEKFYLSS